MQIITIADASGPAISLMKGHVDILDWMMAIFEKDWMAEDQPYMEKMKAKDIEHTYGKELENGKWLWNIKPEETGAIPITIKRW